MQRSWYTDEQIVATLEKEEVSERIGAAAPLRGCRVRSDVGLTVSGGTSFLRAIAYSVGVRR